MFGDMSLLEFCKASPTMVVLLACSVVTVGFAVERTLYFATTATNARSFLRDLSQRMQASGPQAALELCQSKRSSLARVMAQAVTHLRCSREEITQRVNTAIEVEQVEMERNLSVLGTMSNIAPLLGLFGTVVGIIRAFADIARTGSGGGAVVAMGVSEALLTTAAGIIVAVVATVFFNIFVRRIRKRSVELEDAREVFLTVRTQIKRRAQQRQATQTRRITEPLLTPPRPVTQEEELVASVLG
ncbi:MAG: MotA/TolQ/ExbB proton channel family protein [bacterium]